MEVASIPFLDLLTEVEEVSTLGHGKVHQLDFSSCFGDVEGGGVPSLCLPDGLLPQALFGDPLLPLPLLNQDAPTSPPPAAPQPETLMTVSLPAGQPPSPALGPASAPRLRSSPSSSTEERTAVPPVPSPPQEETPALTLLESAQPSAPSSPVRVVVRTSSMVAPVTPGKSSRYLVRIPRLSPLQATPTPTVTRHRVLRAGGKLGPAAAAASQSTKVPRLQAPHTPEPPPTTTTTTTPGVPFRSLAVGVQGGGRQRCSSGNKRKAYELEPQDDPLMERCRQNAINARRNRELKKAQMAELERRAEEADQERCRLAEENRRLKEDNTRLQREVGHLSGVLRNQSRLSDILEKVSPARLTLGDATPLEEEKGAGVSRGVCLHLDGDEATLECCSVCAKKAGKRLRHST